MRLLCLASSAYWRLSGSAVLFLRRAAFRCMDGPCLLIVYLFPGVRCWRMCRLRQRWWQIEDGSCWRQCGMKSNRMSFWDILTLGRTNKSERVTPEYENLFAFSLLINPTQTFTRTLHPTGIISPYPWLLLLCPFFAHLSICPSFHYLPIKSSIIYLLILFVPHQATFVEGRQSELMIKSNKLKIIVPRSS